MRKPFEAILLIVGLALTTACGSGAAAAGNAPRVAATPASSSPAGARQVTVEVGNSMSFAPSTIDVRAGQPVELTLRNGGLIPHDFSISEGVSRPVKIEVGGGSNSSTTFTIDRPGAYTFICSVPGHEAAGMKGTITAR